MTLRRTVRFDRRLLPWLAVVVLTAAATLGVQSLLAGRSVRAQAGTAGARAGEDGLFVAAGQITQDSYGLYLVDPRARRICVYQWLPTPRQLRLLAVRNVRYDLQLDEYNTAPLPREIRQLVDEGLSLEEASPEAAAPTETP
jgi:hypothetical protein